MSHSVRTETRHGPESNNNRCRHCGAHVSPTFARVFGDNEDEVHACPDCATMRELRNGAGRLPSS